MRSESLNNLFNLRPTQKSESFPLPIANTSESCDAPKKIFAISRHLRVKRPRRHASFVSEGPLQLSALQSAIKPHRNRQSNCIGSTELPLDLYRKKCEQKISQLEFKLANMPNKKGITWTRLSKQRNSYASRLN